MHLGQFPGDAAAPVAEHLKAVLHHLLDPVRRLVEDQRHRIAAVLPQFFQAVGPSGRQEPRKQERLDNQAAGHQGIEHGVGPGQRHHVETHRRSLADNPLARITDQGIAGIADQGDVMALGKQVDDPLGSRILVEILIGNQPVFNLKVLEQLA